MTSSEMDHIVANLKEYPWVRPKFRTIVDNKIWYNHNWHNIPKEETYLIWMSLVLEERENMHREFGCDPNGVFECPRCRKWHNVYLYHWFVCPGCVKLICESLKKDHAEFKIDLHSQLFNDRMALCTSRIEQRDKINEYMAGKIWH